MKNSELYLGPTYVYLLTSLLYKATIFTSLKIISQQHNYKLKSLVNKMYSFLLIKICNTLCSYLIYFWIFLTTNLKYQLLYIQHR